MTDPEPPAERPLLEHWLPLLLLVGLLAFAFQGSRSIWEPDEGFYVNVSLGMLNSGDWIVPRLNEQPFLDKPPLLYWGTALGLGLLGKNEWGARIPHALWFCGTVLLVGLLARHLLGAGRGRVAALVYSTSVLPFVGANVLTPDTVLAFCAALALLCYWRALSDAEGASRRILWWLAFGAAMGLGALAKGPAMFVFMAPIAIHYVWRVGFRRALLDPLPYAAVMVAAIIVLPWYGAIAAKLPGAGPYFLDNQVMGRLMTTRYHRNSGNFLSGIVYYLPVLAVGGLPWSLAAMPSLFRRARFRGLWRRIADGPGSSPFPLLTLAVFIPLVVLMAAQSRLPFYVLPLCVPLTLVTVNGMEGVLWHRISQRRPMLVPALILGWAVVLIGIKGGAALLVNERCTSVYAAALDAVPESRGAEIVAVDIKLNGLPLYGYTSFEAVTTDASPYPFFADIEALKLEAKEMGTESEREPHMFIVPSEKFHQVSSTLRKAEFHCRTVREIYNSILLYCPSPERAAD